MIGGGDCCVHLRARVLLGHLECVRRVSNGTNTLSEGAPHEAVVDWEGEIVTCLRRHVTPISIALPLSCCSYRTNRRSNSFAHVNVLLPYHDR